MCSLNSEGGGFVYEELIFPRCCQYYLQTYFLLKRGHKILQTLIEKCQVPYRVGAADAVLGNLGVRLRKKHWLSLSRHEALKAHL